MCFTFIHNVHITSAGWAWRSEEGIIYSGTGVAHAVSHHVTVGTNPALLEEQQALLTDEPPFQPQYFTS